MNCLKMCKIGAGMMGFTGFFLMACAVGTSDYMDAIGECHPFTEMLPTAVLGLVLMIGGVLLYKKLQDDWVDCDEDEYWEDEIFND